MKLAPPDQEMVVAAASEGKADSAETAAVAAAAVSEEEDPSRKNLVHFRKRNSPPSLPRLIFNEFQSFGEASSPVP